MSPSQYIKTDIRESVTNAGFNLLRSRVLIQMPSRGTPYIIQQSFQFREASLEAVDFTVLLLHLVQQHGVDFVVLDGFKVRQTVSRSRLPGRFGDLFSD
jgi:hypothetical protein